MPRTVQKTLSFPLAGVARRRGYREQPRPYATPWAINVRGVGPLEARERGGSRPCLTRVNSNDFGAAITALLPITSIDSDGDRQHDLVIICDGTISYLRGSTVSTIEANLLWPDGNAMLWEDGTNIVFDATVSAANPIGDTNAYHAAERGGKLYLADSVLRVYDPNTGVIDPVTPKEGSTLPTAEPLIAVYRDRLFLTGKNHIWHASRTSDFTDWDMGAEMTDVGRAVAGQLEHAGGIGAVPKALIPHRDKVLVMACENSLWTLRGDPTTGQIDAVTEDIGIISPEAWAKTPDGLIAFLSNDGLYLWDVGANGRPMRFSEERIPGELRNVSGTTNTINMVYDPVGRGFHLFITPLVGIGTHWWLDLDNKALWPVRLASNHQPLAVSRVEGSGLSEVVLGCKDGILRKFSSTATQDDGVDIESHVLLGPFRISQNDVKDAMLAEIHGILADNDDFVTWRVMMGESAETVADAAVLGINAVLNDEDAIGVSASGNWEGLRNLVERPRARGAWVIVWLSSDARWSYEAVSVVARQLGRLR